MDGEIGTSAWPCEGPRARLGATALGVLSLRRMPAARHVAALQSHGGIVRPWGLPARALQRRLPGQFELRKKPATRTGVTGSDSKAFVSCQRAGARWAQQGSNLRPADYESAALIN